MQDNGNSELNNLIKIGLLESISRPTWTPDMDNISKELIGAIQEQNQIGWQHVYYGRISQKLIKSMDQHFKHLPINQLKYCTQVKDGHDNSSKQSGTTYYSCGKNAKIRLIKPFKQLHKSNAWNDKSTTAMSTTTT
jgi:hypothetical protein